MHSNAFGYNSTGVAVGCGWQAFVAYVNVGCYYVVGIPLGCLLGFKFDLGAKVYQFITLSFPFLCPPQIICQCGIILHLRFHALLLSYTYTICQLTLRYRSVIQKRIIFIRIQHKSYFLCHIIRNRHISVE